MSDFVLTINEAELAAILADYYAASNDQRPNEFTPSNPSVVNTVNVAIAPSIPTAGNLQPTIDFATATAAASVANFGKQETPLVVTLLETLDDAGDLAGYLIQPVPKFWFGNIQIIMNGLTDAQRTTITNLDIGSQISVTKTFPKSTPSTVTQLMALEGISHDISPDRHIVTLYTNPARIYTYFIVGGYPLTTRTNLLPNPSFETNTTGWTAYGATIARVAGTFGTGSWVGQVVYNNTLGGGGYTDTIAVTPNQAYTASATVLRTVGARSYYVLLIYYNGATELITFGSSINTCATATRMSATGTAPANATHARVFVYSSTASTVGDTYQVDSVLLETGSTLLPYFDGANADPYTGFALNSKAWTGTANASTSVGTWYQGATRTNLVPNPSFETNTTGWAGSNVALAQSTAFAYSGIYSMQGTVISTGINRYIDKSIVTVTGSTAYSYSCWAYLPATNTADTSWALQVYEWNGTAYTVLNALETKTITRGVWTRFSGSFTTAATTIAVQPRLIHAPSIAAGQLVYLDGALLETGLTVRPYFDGTYADTYTGYTLTSQAWSGTADASTSTANWGLTSAFIGSQIGDDTKGLG